MGIKLYEDLREHLSDININWHICGGFAIDAYLGEATRMHKDLDITVSFADMRNCIDHLMTKGWEIDAPIGGGRLVPINYALKDSNLYFDNIWCYRKDSDFIRINEVNGIFKFIEFTRKSQDKLDFIEVLFNKVEDGFFHYKRNLAITRDLEKAFIKKEGVNILAPELVLLYKSTAPNNPDYRHDFDVVVDKLDEERYKWFLGAMQTAYPTGHPWLK